jgi:hypothetical protein
VKKQTPKMEAMILEWTRRAPPDGSTHWSSRKLAEHLGVHHMMVARVWQRARLQPQRIERYMMSNDLADGAKLLARLHRLTTFRTVQSVGHGARSFHQIASARCTEFEGIRQLEIASLTMLHFSSLLMELLSRP